MNKLIKGGIVLLIMISFIAMPIFADDYKDLTKRIEKALKDEDTSSYDKANLVRKLSAYPSAETVKFCYKILKYKDKNAKKIERDIEQVKAEIAKLKKELEILYQPFSGSQQEIDRRRKEIQKVQDDIRKKQEFILKLEDKLNSMSVAKTAVIYVLGKMDKKEAQKAMLEGLDERDWRIIYATIQGFAKQKFKRAFAKIAQHYPVDGKPHKSDLVRGAAIKALRILDERKAMNNLIVALDDENSIIRTEAVHGLGQIGETECIMPLINQIEKESGRLKWEIITILTNLTGKSFGENVKEWRSWWNANKDTFELKEVDDVLKKTERGEGSHKTGITFYGVDVETDHPIFVIDQSGSMQATADLNMYLKQIEKFKKENPGKQIPPLPPPSGYMSKWEVLQFELKKVIMKLDTKKADFNIVWYSTDVEIYSKDGMVEATVKEKARTEKEIDRRRANGFTNIYDALETAFMLATGKTKKGESEWTGKGDNEMYADTFFFMTDGSPDDGDHSAVSQKEDVQFILKKVREWNKSAKIKIHTIGVGLCHEPFLKALAAENDGTFTVHKEEPDKDKR